MADIVERSDGNSEESALQLGVSSEVIQLESGESALGGTVAYGLDEESPLIQNREVSPPNVNGGVDSSLTDDASDKSDSVLSHPMLLPHAGASQGAMPLIILPVQSEGMPSSGGFPLGRGNPPNTPAPPQGEELKKVLSQQLEYYFCKDNLSSDKYLLSQMDGDNFVPISVISNFNQVKRLTTDPSLILDSLRASSVLQLDEGEEKVRAIPEKRCVLILREIPKETPKEDIVSLFSHEKCPRCVTCEFADNNCWYVTFDSEEMTQKAFTFLREQVKEFLGQPIRARIKGTTVQRSSGMPKAKHVPFNMQYNGAPSQLPYYQPPSSTGHGGVAPWSPNPPTSSSTPPFFEHSNFSPYGGNGFTPPQQPPPSNQVGATGQSSAVAAAGGGAQPPSFNGVRYPGGGGGGGGFPYMGRGRMAPPSTRLHRGAGLGPGGGDRGQSPPVSASDGDTPTVASDRDKSDPKGGRGIREHTVGGGTKYRHFSEERKIPRLKNTRHGGVRGGADLGDGDRTSDKNPPPPRQQTKQPKLDLATFPPLPTSTSSDNGALPVSAPPTISHSHTFTEDGQKTLSDIVRGSTRPLAKEPSGSGPSQNPALAVTVAASVVEKSIVSATAKLSVTQTHTLPSPPTNPAPQEPQTPPQPSPNLDLNPPALSGTDVAAKVCESGSVGGKVVTVVTASPRPVTASSIVSSGPSLVNNVAGRAPPPPAASVAAVVASPPVKTDSKVSGKDKSNGNKAYSRYSDREITSSKQNRNSQVAKSESRSTSTSNTRGRHKDKDVFVSRNNNLSSNAGNTTSRPPNGSRLNHTKSPKSFKKTFPPHSSPQAPPPPPIPGDVQPAVEEVLGSGTKSDSTSSVSHSQSVSSGKREKLSYAQMAQKKNTADSKASDPVSLAEGGAKATSPPTSPQTSTTTPPAPQSTTRSIKSTSTGSLAVGQGQGSGTMVSKSAPTSPTKDSSSVSSM